MMVCIMLCVVMVYVNGYAQYSTAFTGDQYSVTKDGTYYGSDNELLQETAEKVQVKEVYVKGTLKVSDPNHASITITEILK